MATIIALESNVALFKRYIDEDKLVAANDVYEYVENMRQYTEEEAYAVETALDTMSKYAEEHGYSYNEEEEEMKNDNTDIVKEFIVAMDNGDTITMLDIITKCHASGHDVIANSLLAIAKEGGIILNSEDTYAEQAEGNFIAFLAKCKEFLGVNYNYIAARVQGLKTTEDLLMFQYEMSVFLRDKINTLSKRGTEEALKKSAELKGIIGLLNKAVDRFLWMIRKIAQKVGQAYDKLCQLPVIGKLFTGIKAVASALLGAAKVVITFAGELISWALVGVSMVVVKIIDIIKNVVEWVKNLLNKPTESTEATEESTELTEEDNH